MRPLQFNREGLAENPVGHTVVWRYEGREYLLHVTGHYTSPLTGDGQAMLLTRVFSGNPGPDVPAGDVFVLEPSYPPEDDGSWEELAGAPLDWSW